MEEAQLKPLYMLNETVMPGTTLYILHESTELIMYADDTNVFFSSDNLISLEVSVNNYLSNLSNWLRQNGLRLNAKKNNLYDIPTYKQTY